jgi:hypothetical protein
MLNAFLNSLFGCSHSRTTFPQTPGRTGKSATAGRNGMYVVCLDCGKEFAYDWNEMRVGRQVGVKSPSNTAALAPVAEGRLEGLRRHVS